MSWADNYIKFLKEGQTIKFRPRGNSMRGRIESGQLVTVEPVKAFEDLSTGDVVLCRVNGYQYLHLVKQLSPTLKKVLIGNNKGRLNGWTSFDKVYGKVIKVEP